MGKRKMKVLIVAGNVVAVFAIIAIVLLYNLNTQSVTIDENESREEDPEETDSKSEPSIEFRKINHSETVDSVDESVPEDGGTEQVAQRDEADPEEEEPTTSEEETEVNETEKNYVDTDEEEQVAIAEDTSESSTWERTTSGNTSNTNESAGSDSKSGESASKEKKDEPIPEETEEKEDSIKKEETEPEPLTYTEKVQNRLPGYTVTGENPVTVSNKNGRVANIVDGQVIIRTKDSDLAKQIVNKLSGLATP